MTRRSLWGLLGSIIVALLFLSGCVERTLTIRTSPADARVILNDEDVGVSPTTVSFQWYGDYDVRISKTGFQTLQTHRKLQAPWYYWFPFDFFAQVLLPHRIVDTYEWNFDLEPVQPRDRDDVIEQALLLKQQFDDMPVAQ